MIKSQMKFLENDKMGAIWMMSKSVKLEVSYMSIIGNSRSHNEDSLFSNGFFLNQRETITVSKDIFFEDSVHLFGVFDGIGGESAGDLASSIASKGHEYIYNYLKSESLGGSIQASYHSYVDVINQRIIKEKKKRFLNQMGTTLATLVFKDGWVYPFFLGDSRIYRFRKDSLLQLSEDHTETAMLIRLGILKENQASSHPSFGKLRQFMGKEEGEVVFEVDSYPSFECMPGDCYLICSDGLSHFVNGNELRWYLASEDNPSAILDRLFNSVLEKKSDDNITGIIIKVV